VHGGLDAAGQLEGLARHVGQVDIDLIDAAVFDFRRDAQHGLLEQPRIVAVGVEVHRQQHRVRRQLGRLHHAHRRADAERPRFVGGGGDDAAADVVAQPGEAARAVGLGDRLVVAPAADDDGLAAQLGILQQFHGRVEGVHVQVGDAAVVRVHGTWAGERIL